jgi:hypothetical protein
MPAPTKRASYLAPINSATDAGDVGAIFPLRLISAGPAILKGSATGLGAKSFGWHNPRNVNNNYNQIK